MYAPLIDNYATVSGIVFVGKDLDPDELGGEITWVPPDYPKYVLRYTVYLSVDLSAETRLLIGNPVPVGTNTFTVPPDFPRGIYTQLLVYTNSKLIEQSFPASHKFHDTYSQAHNLSFIDLDLDKQEIGGSLTWSDPEDDAHVTHYNVYMSFSALGNARFIVGEYAFGTNEVLIPNNYFLYSFTHFTIFARSSLEEQTTPAAIEIVDTHAPVKFVAYVDKDLDVQ